MKKVKIVTRNLKRELKKGFNNDPFNILIPVLSIIIATVASFTISIRGAILLFIVINCVYFIPHHFKNIDKKKHLNKNQMKAKTKKRWKIFLLILLACFILGIMGMIIFFSYIVIKAPNFSEESLYVTNPTVVLDKDGKDVEKLGAEKRVTITYDQMPEVLVDAIVATEDSRFFEHKGVDWARFLKASAYQLLGYSGAGGASTLTMQVSKNAFTSTESHGLEGIIRKFTDVYVAMFKIEKNYTKEQIMEFYVNSYYLGNNAYGVEQASLSYFGKSAKDLNLAEASMIAGLFQAPGKYNPYVNPDATEARRQTVLKLMLRHNYITKDEYDVAKKMTVDKIIIKKDSNGGSNSLISKYQTFIDTLVEEVQEKTGQNPYTSSMTIHSTLNTGIQNSVNDIMNGDTYTWENDAVQAGVAIISVKDGSVAAIGGGRNVNIIDSYNYATDIKNQIGSTAKPLYDYGPAIEYNNWNTYHILVDEPISYSDGTSINNWNGAFEGFETMRVALSGSRNIPALKTFKANNKAKVIEFVEKVGLSPEIYSCKAGYKLDGKNCINENDENNIVKANKASTLHEAHAIGGYNGESPLTMAAAYTTFANGGYYTKPYTFTKLTYQDTGEEFVNDISKAKVISDETAYMISDMLATTATIAMGRSYNINGIKYAAKTGTTNYPDELLKAKGLYWSGAINDLWVIGFNTEYTMGIWYGYDSLSTEHYSKFNSGQHTRLFQAIGQKLFTNANYFAQPAGVVAVEVESGCPEATLPSEFTPSDLRQTELFIKGTEPTTISTRFSKLDDVSNLKAKSSENKITLTWDAVKTPEINTESYLKNYYSKTFENQSFLNSYISNRISYNNSYIGTIGYNVYKKLDNGTLTLLDYVSTNKYETSIDKSGNYTFVVKTAYSIFKSNMSNGKSVGINVTSSLIPTDPDTDDENNNDDSINNNG